MRVLFVHQNFPSQFKHLAPALVARGDDVKAMAFNKRPPIAGVDVHLSSSAIGSETKHPWVIDIESKLIRAEASLRTASALAAKGYRPDVIVAHPAWGEALFLKDIWPTARIATYCEFYYHPVGADHDFDPEFITPEAPAAAVARTRIKNLTQKLHFDFVDAGLSPTRFQADTYPPEMRQRITVVHDGIDTEAVSPGPSPVFHLGGRTIGPDDEIITFVSRHLEPYRGLHILIRALPELLRRRPNAQVIVVGSDGRGYGPACPTGAWRQKFLSELAEPLDPKRVHFVGELQYPVFLNLLRISSLHIYLTYPFVLSWSMLEAMASGAAILASDVAPVREFITDGENGALVPFFDKEALVARACAMLDDRDMRRHYGERARRTVMEVADLKTICLPRQLEWIDALANARPRTGAAPT